MGRRMLHAEAYVMHGIIIKICCTYCQTQLRFCGVGTSDVLLWRSMNNTVSYTAKMHWQLRASGTCCAQPFVDLCCSHCQTQPGSVSQVTCHHQEV